MNADLKPLLSFLFLFSGLYDSIQSTVYRRSALVRIELSTVPFWYHVYYILVDAYLVQWFLSRLPQSKLSPVTSTKFLARKGGVIASINIRLYERITRLD